MNGLKIIVAHPDKQHSFRLAAALKREGHLFKYFTTVYNNKKSWTNFFLKFLKGDSLKKANSRYCNELEDDDVIQFCELENLLLILFARLSFPLTINRYLKKIVIDRFGLKVAKYAIINNVDAVIMYDSTSFICFRYLKKKAPHILRILDVSTVSHSFMKRIFDEEIANTGKDTIKKEFPYIWNLNFLKRCDNEIFLSNFFLSPSEIVTKSLEYNGISKKQILHVPYGVDISKFTFSHKEVSNKLKLLFVGHVSCRKGINHLLNAISHIPEDTIELFIAGNFDINADWYLECKDKRNIHFLGFVTNDVIANLYQEADLFVLPSLAEGLALVGLESLACGVPVICSQFSGVNDLIKDQLNGFVINIFNENELKEKLIYCLSNQSIIPNMRINARKIAEQYSWEIYSKNVVKSLMSKLLIYG